MERELRVGTAPLGHPATRALLVEFITSGAVTRDPTLEIGAGTGTHAIGWRTAVLTCSESNVSLLTVERAHAKMERPALRYRFAAGDFLVAPVPDGPFASSERLIR